MHFNDALINVQQFFSVAEICLCLKKKSHKTVNQYVFVYSDFHLPLSFLCALNLLLSLSLSLSRYFLKSPAQFHLCREVWWKRDRPEDREGWV